MKVRPILMHAWSITNLLAGRKTQTRRIVKPAFGAKHPIVNLKEHGESTGNYSGQFNDPASWGYPYAEDGADMPLSAWPELCRYGKPGDLLWVRETWGYRGRGSRYSSAEGGVQRRPWDEVFIHYQADQSKATINRPCDNESGIPQQRPRRADELYVPDYNSYLNRYWAAWRPSIHMPRWASRLTLRLTDVRVERVQDINEIDCRAEGIEKSPFQGNFALLWDDTNGIGAWKRNDWTWALSFELFRENVNAVLARKAVA